MGTMRFTSMKTILDIASFMTFLVTSLIVGGWKVIDLTSLRSM